MQNNRFVVLTGHLSNYPLSDLVGILRHQRKSGRLLIEYSKGPAMFFFQDGELIDARLNDLSGLQAICVALAQPEAAFNFNPLIQSSRRSIEHSLQRVVSELLGCWDESTLQIESAVAVASLDGSGETATPSRILQGGRAETLALTPGPSSLLRQRPVLFIAAAVLVVIGLSTGIAVTGGFKGDSSATAVAATTRPLGQSQQSESPGAAQAGGASRQVGPAAGAKSNRQAATQERREEKRSKSTENSQSVAALAPAAVDEANRTTKESDKAPPPIKVVMQIENGRVLKASIANHKPGMESYEALALRIARQRRYPATLNGGETVTISIGRPD